MLDEAFDKFEDTMRKDTVGDQAHKNLFALADELEGKDPVKYKNIIERCRNGYYHDFATKVAFPKMEMHADLLAAGLNDVDERMQDGEFDHDPTNHPSKDVKQSPSHLTSQNEMVSIDTQAQGGGDEDLQSKLEQIVAAHTLEWKAGHNHLVVEQVMEVFAGRLRVQLGELEVEGPKRMTQEDALTSGWIDDEYRAFNQSSAQWRALLARKKGETKL